MALAMAGMDGMQRAFAGLLGAVRALGIVDSTM